MEPKKQFLPTLLDRLIDDEPRLQQEHFDRFFFDARKMRAIVLRDVMSILNNANIENLLDEDRHKCVAESIVNFGLAPSIGSCTTQHNWGSAEKIIREAILRFEPRIIPESLRITLPNGQGEPFKNGMILFEIQGLIYWDPYPIDLAAKYVYDRENDKIVLKQS